MSEQAIRVILASHGSFAVEALNTLTMIAGDQPGLMALELQTGDALDDFHSKYDEIILADPDSSFLILTDIAGGTPSNAATQLLFTYQNLQVFSGFNLPLLLDLVTNEWQSLEEVATHITASWPLYLSNINTKMTRKDEHYEY